MIIAFSGFPGTGKTQTFMRVWQALNWPKLPNIISYDTWERHYGLQNEAKFRGRQWWELPVDVVEQYQLASMSQVCTDVYFAGPTNYLFKRSPFTSKVYAVYAHSLGLLSTQVLDSIVAMYDIVTSLRKDLLHTMFFVPDSVDSKETESVPDQEALKELFLQQALSLPNCFFVPAGSIEEKVTNILNYIKERV